MIELGEIAISRRARDRLTLVTQAIHVSKKMTMLNLNHVGASKAGEGVKEPESGLTFQEMLVQRRVAIPSEYKQRKRNLRRRCRYG